MIRFLHIFRNLLFEFNDQLIIIYNLKFAYLLKTLFNSKFK
jgi:hypothetical protein